MRGSSTLIKTLQELVNKEITKTKPMSNNEVVLFVKGSNLQAVKISKLSY